MITLHSSRKLNRRLPRTTKGSFNSDTICKPPTLSRETNTVNKPHAMEM